ncbi:carboxypeptidase-like regulatory domain-containing protein [Hymenobacter sp. 5317J-9]|uniref:carboxypeptidase-like regulatory domain-containing protein n=1 Tax=Hymenobacter sp. 5317J-9 TaxID=2932250 RepID=UPI001FD671B1|nr:carboxypeptidase-like regulatory domain-containing protein [Hymenobacter sp. 5317J-9]UOQ96436.1 carboxypeptidase-like regulatory domain-containing protein [Hymenobacter sp. 5317J-9]
MHNHLQALFLIGALGATLLCGACSDAGKNLPQPSAPAATPAAVPSITGRIQPADALLSVQLVDNKTHQTITSAKVDGTTGNYQFDALPVDTYELSFTNKNFNYVPPRQQSVTVTAGKTTVVPTISVVRAAAFFTANNVAYSPPFIDIFLNYDGIRVANPQCVSIALSDAIIQMPPSPATYVLHLNMPWAITVGTYPLNGALTYAIFKGSGSGIFDSRLSGGTLTITQVNNKPPFPRSISGTFSFTGISASSGTSKSLDGTFSNVYY